MNVHGLMKTYFQWPVFLGGSKTCKATNTVKKQLLHNVISSHITLISLSPSHTHKPKMSFHERIPLPPQCSTTCGIGAIWRTVVCSSQNDVDCDSMKRPEPARTCHLQPCATWQSGSWSKVHNVHLLRVNDT